MEIPRNLQSQKNTLGLSPVVVFLGLTYPASGDPSLRSGKFTADVSPVRGDVWRYSPDPKKNGCAAWLANSAVPLVTHSCRGYMPACGDYNHSDTCYTRIIPYDISIIPACGGHNTIVIIALIEPQPQASEHRYV